MQSIDLRGIQCPSNFVMALLALEKVDAGETVELLLDDGEPVRKVPHSLKGEGHRFLGLAEKEGYYVLTLEKGFSTKKAVAVVREYISTRFTRNGCESTLDPVMVEETLDLIVNGNMLSSIVTTPELHKELAVGYLVTEGAVKNSSDIQKITETGRKIFLQIRSFEHMDMWHELRSSGCVGVSWDRRDEEQVHVPMHRTFSIEVLLDSLKYLYDEIQQQTGGAHSASLVGADGRLKYKALDLGRHNAIDKVVGMAVLNGEDLSEMFLLTSGRQPAGVVMKAARAGIPLIMSKGAPTGSGIDCAQRSNVTLCCFADAEKAKVFSVPERIKSWQLQTCVASDFRIK